MEKRKAEITLTSIIFMLLVIFIHASSDAVKSYPVESVAFAVVCSLNRLASFVVQGFIFLSGLRAFLNFREDFSLGKYYISRIIRVVLPYFIVYNIFYLYLSLTHMIEPSVSHYFENLLTGGLVGHLYFVIIILQFYLLMPLWRWMYRKVRAVIAVPLSLLITIMSKVAVPEFYRLIFQREFTYESIVFLSYLFYFVAGLYAAKYYRQFCEYLRKKKILVAVSWAVCGLITCFLLYAIRRGWYYPQWAENMHVLYCAAAIMFFFSAGISLSGTKMASSAFINLTDRSSYLIYLIHPVFIFLIDSLMLNMGIGSTTVKLVIRILFAVIVPVSVCVLYTFLKDKTAAAVRRRK